LSEPASALIDWLEARIFGDTPFQDVRDRWPDFGDKDAYAARARLVARRIAGGDRLVGYKVAGSSVAVRKDEHVEGPIVGCVMASRVVSNPEAVATLGGRMAIEGEIAVLVKRDLVGPGVTLIDAYAATEAIFPAFELLSLRPGPKPSHPDRIVASNFAGAFVFGGPLRSPHGIDLQAEGMVLHVNGTYRGSASGIEVLGHPLAALPLVANTLATCGESLKAGMVVMTGSICPNVAVTPGDSIEATFSSLGRIAMRLSR
jgi:2-keto-4-pentenoate hydratase